MELGTSYESNTMTAESNGITTALLRPLIYY